jgi:DNA-binding MarR family transcriptional regulator
LKYKVISFYRIDLFGFLIKGVIMPVNICQSDLKELVGLDQLIHTPARLVTVMLLHQAQTLDFIQLMNYTNLTWGNLSTHLSKLEAEGYVMITKTFKGKRPRTLVSLTEAGRQAYLQWGRIVTKALPEYERRQIPSRPVEYEQNWWYLQTEPSKPGLPAMGTRDVFFLPRYHRWSMELAPIKEFLTLS